MHRLGRARGPAERADVGRIYQDISVGGQWFWSLNDRVPSPAADRGYAPRRAKAMLALKHRWRERGPLKPGEMQVGPSIWMRSQTKRKTGLHDLLSVSAVTISQYDLRNTAKLARMVNQRPQTVAKRAVRTKDE